MTADFVIVQGLNGVAYGLLLFLLAAGLSLIFGMMDVVNLAHGSFFMLGAYIGYSAARSTQNFWVALLVAPVAVGALVLLMDEPSEGLAPLIVREIGRVIGELKQSGIAILLAEQNLAMALSVADRCYVLNKGQVVTETTAAALKADEQVKHRFLGV